MPGSTFEPHCLAKSLAHVKAPSIFVRWAEKPQAAKLREAAQGPRASWVKEAQVLALQATGLVISNRQIPKSLKKRWSQMVAKWCWRMEETRLFGIQCVVWDYWGCKDIKVKVRSQQDTRTIPLSYRG